MKCESCKTAEAMLWRESPQGVSGIYLCEKCSDKPQYSDCGDAIPVEQLQNYDVETGRLKDELPKEVQERLMRAEAEGTNPAAIKTLIELYGEHPKLIALAAELREKQIVASISDIAIFALSKSHRETALPRHKVADTFRKAVAVWEAGK